MDYLCGYVYGKLSDIVQYIKKSFTFSGKARQKRGKSVIVGRKTVKDKDISTFCGYILCVKIKYERRIAKKNRKT